MFTLEQAPAIAHPVDSRLLEIARAKVVQAAKRAGIALKQTFMKEGKELRRKAGGYSHAKQFKRLRRAVTYCEKFNSELVGDVTINDVEAALRPIWLEKTETATRVLARIVNVMGSHPAA